MDLTDYRAVTALLERHGFHFSKAMGQNFLTAAWVPERIAAASGTGPGEGVLEVGPGVGCLTAALADLGGRVLALELDKRLKPVLAETLAGRDNVSVVFTDAARADLNALCKLHLGERPWRVCANLPYNVTTPLLTAFFRAGCFESVTVMVQREVARRLCAVPGTGEYGAFTVLVQWYSTPTALFDVPPDCFTPRPKVTSTVVRMDRRTAPPARVEDEDFFFRVVRAAFGQRRKTLPNALSALIPGLGRAAAEAAMGDLGMDPRRRGETLSLEEFAALANALGKWGKSAERLL